MTLVSTPTDPYGAAFEKYIEAGWTSPLPLPFGKKWPPPPGYTGRAAIPPSGPDMFEWGYQSLQPQNICLHLPRGLAGIDVDAYGGKNGAATLAALEAECGPLPPTIRSTSREGISGIRIYRVPVDVEFIGGLDGVDIIQASHRYVVCWPSEHPEGGQYQWIDERTGEILDGAPSIDLIADLPPRWVDRLRSAGNGPEKMALSMEARKAVLDGFPPGPACECVDRFAAKVQQPTKSRHDAYMEATLSVAAAGRRGCPGAAEALQGMYRTFIDAIADRATPEDAAGEFMRMLEGALALVAAEPQGNGCEQLRVDEWVGSLGEEFERVEEQLWDEHGNADHALIDEHFPVLDWHEVWAADNKERWLAEPLVALGRMTALYSPPKMGKSLLMLEIAAAIATGREIFGYGACAPTKVLYIDFENDPRGDVRTRLAAMGYGPDDLDNLVYLSFPSLSALDTEKGSRQVMAIAERHGCVAVLIDTVSRAIQGEENDNDTWLAFYRHTGLKIKQAGMALVRLDHAGKDVTKGQRGGSAKSGDVDSVWRLSATDVERGIFTLECEARRFVIPETRLTLVRRTSPLRHEVDEDAMRNAMRADIARCIEYLDKEGVDIALGYKKAHQITAADGHSERITKAAQERRREREKQLEWVQE